MYLHLKDNTPTQIKVELDTVYEESDPSFNTMKRWSVEFECGHTNVADDDRSGRPITSTTTDNNLKNSWDDT